MVLCVLQNSLIVEYETVFASDLEWYCFDFEQHMRTHTHASHPHPPTHSHIPTHTHTPTHCNTQMHTRMHKHTHMHEHTHTHTHTHAQTRLLLGESIVDNTHFCSNH